MAKPYLLHHFYAFVLFNIIVGLCCAGTADRRGKERKGKEKFPLEKETEGVYVPPFFFALLFSFLIGKGLSWAHQ